MTWASACSASSRGKCVSLPAQSRNELRKPCAVYSDLARRNSISNAIFESGRPGRRPGKTKSPVRTFSISLRIETARSDRGTRCSRAALVRSAGTVQTFESKSNSFQPEANVSLDRVAVRTQNSSARAAGRFLLTKFANECGNVRVGHCRMMAARELGALRQQFVQMAAPASRILAAPMASGASGV